MGARQIDFVFDGPPGPEAGRFVEAENPDGQSVKVGEWLERPDGKWALRVVLAEEPVGPEAPPEGVGLAEATRRIARLRDELQTEHVRHQAEVESLERRIAKANGDRDLVLGGMTLDVVQIAESILEVKGRENVGKGEGRAAVADAIFDIAAGAPQLRALQIATKRYDRWDGQREDAYYGSGPKHGSIIFSIGLKPEYRNRPVEKPRSGTTSREPERVLTDPEKDAAIAYLHAILGTLARP